MIIVLMYLLRLVIVVKALLYISKTTASYIVYSLLLELGTDSYTEVVPAPQGGWLW
jgi:hypothetical protein